MDSNKGKGKHGGGRGGEGRVWKGCWEKWREGGESVFFYPPPQPSLFYGCFNHIRLLMVRLITPLVLIVTVQV